MTTPELDKIYSTAMEAGALGGKLLGAGGGGYFLFYTDSKFRYNVEKKLKAMGLTTSRVSFESKGLQSWKVRKG